MNKGFAVSSSLFPFVQVNAGWQLLIRAFDSCSVGDFNFRVGKLNEFCLLRQSWQGSGKPESGSGNRVRKTIDVRGFVAYRANHFFDNDD
jgi:hypothetical protein